MRRQLLGLLLVAWAGGAARGQDAKSEARVAADAYAVLRKHCAGCHGLDGTNDGGMNFILDAKQLVARKRVVPGEPKKSKLLRKIYEGEMPPEEVKVRPTKEEVQALERWVAAGAPAFVEQAAKRRTLTTRSVLTALRADLLKARREDRPYRRYYTLTHLHNNPKVSDADLRLYRAALSKLVNSLHWEHAIVVPRAIDPEQTVLAIDLRDVRWDRGNLWDAVLKTYPYGLQHDGDPDEDVQELARQVYELAGTDLPFLRADWFVGTASRGDKAGLYHTLLRLPETGAELERKLNVNLYANIVNEEAKRAGFATSGVSNHNRMIERHKAAYGAYWRSYDFKNDEGRRNLFSYPLGPKFDGNPFDRLAFEYDGGEIIFHLPNGLQGYLLVDGKDRRINEGPIDVVSDGTKTSGTPVVVNGLSCISCHGQGMRRDFKDTVREGTALQGRARDRLRRLYVPAKELDALMQQDQDQFMAAAEKATAGFLKVGADKDKKLEDFPEPVGLFARKYTLNEVTLADAALELGLADPGRLAAAIRSNERLRELGLAPLARGGTIKRESWESLDRGVSPFQEAARTLELGAPIRIFNVRGR